MHGKPRASSDWIQSFDPDAPLTSGTLFGLPCSRDQASIVVLPVPWDATASYGKGAAGGPGAIREASLQLDFSDRLFGDAWRAGIWMADIDPERIAKNQRARALTGPIIERGGAEPSDQEAVEEIDSLGAENRDLARSFASEAIADGKVPITLGGEHSVSEGSILGCCESGPLGILQIDAHMDLRDAYEGFRFSHASVIRNAMAPGGVERVVQVGIRDWGAGEQAFAESTGRVETFFDDDLDRSDWPAQCAGIVGRLPRRVYLTIDIDGLDPTLCPSTGTPVPGGLGWRELGLLLLALAESGKAIVGADLVEVAPGPTEWDANVGARVLYRVCGAIARSHSSPD